MHGKFTRWFESIATYFLIFLTGLLLSSLLAVVLQSLGVIEIEVISKISALSKQSEILSLLGIGLGGAVLMLQALIANKRARAMEETAKAQARAADSHATANQNIEKGQRQERLKNAIEHLGSDSESVRLGGTYELFHLAQDTDSLRQSVLSILCSHIRRTTKDETYRKRHPTRPSEEIQSLLTLLFVDEHSVFGALGIDLNGSWLNGADLRNARLRGAKFQRASLNNALLGEARLERVKFTEAHLKQARLGRASLREAQLIIAHMQGAYLEEAWLQGANFMGAKLTSAYLRKAHLQGADLFNTTMYGATLSSAMMQGVRLSWTYLQGSFLDDTNLEGAGDHHWDTTTSFPDRIRSSVGKQSDVSKVVGGGLTQKRVEQLVEEMLCEDKREPLRQQLRPYTDGLHRLGLPEEHGAVIGSYQEDDAEKWIAEHEETMRVTGDIREAGLDGLRDEKSSGP